MEKQISVCYSVVIVFGVSIVEREFYQFFFAAFSDFFPNRCRDILSDTAENQILLASCGKLLFLHVLECQICAPAPVLHGCDVCVGNTVGEICEERKKYRGGGKIF